MPKESNVMQLFDEILQFSVIIFLLLYPPVDSDGVHQKMDTFTPIMSFYLSPSSLFI